MCQELFRWEEALEGESKGKEGGDPWREARAIAVFGFRRQGGMSQPGMMGDGAALSKTMMERKQGVRRTVQREGTCAPMCLTTAGAAVPWQRQQRRALTPQQALPAALRTAQAASLPDL